MLAHDNIGVVEVTTNGAWGKGMIDSTPLYIYDSEVIIPIPELATIALVGAGILELIGIRRYKKR